MKGIYLKKLLLSILVLGLAFAVSGCGSMSESSDTDELETELTEENSGAEEEVANSEEAVANDETFSEDFGSDEEAPEEETAAAENEEDTFDEMAEEEPATEEQAPTEEVAQNPEDELEPSSEETPAETPAERSNRSQVVAINYLSSLNGGSIEIKTSDPVTYKVRPNPSTNQYILEIENADLSESLKRPYIMKDFEGAFGAINAYQNPGSKTARIVLQMKGATGEPVVTQEGNTLLVVPPGSAAATLALSKPVGADAAAAAAKAEEEADTDKDSYDVKQAKEAEEVLSARTLDEFLTGSGRFFGRPISIQTNDADVRDVIQFIAEESGVNLVISDDVQGKVSLKLRQVPWDQALVIVMRSKGLGYVRQGNVLRITKLGTLQAEATAAKDIVESQKKLTPLKVKVMPISYANVTDLATQVKPFLSADRGQAVSDQRTSALIITDTADVLSRVERLVKELDIPPAQVMIEGKIVEASERFTRRVGVSWSLSGSPVQVASSGGANNGAITLFNDLNFQTSSLGQIDTGNATYGLRIGTLDFLGNLEATLSLAQADDMVRIISSPRIVTMNKEKSEISQKSEVITIQTTVDQNNNRTSTPTRTPVELKLEVTPQITAEGSVVLDVSVLRQFPGAEVDQDTLARPINSRSAKTKVLVPNGQTAVIGGIYQSDETTAELGTPGLKDIPVLGWLFKQRSEERIKNELLLFLTPRILNAKDQGVVKE